MLPFAQFDEDLVQTFIAEYAAFGDNHAPFAVTCLDQSKDFPTERMVFILSQDDHPSLVLKIDLAPKPTRLIKEFRTLERLHPLFASDTRVAVIKPVYLSPQGHFHITQYTDGKTAKQKIYAKPDLQAAGQIYRRGGEWLHQLHATEPLEQADIFLHWMFEEIEARRSYAKPQAESVVLDRYITVMQADLVRFNKRQAYKAFSHGDFHGGNLILPQRKSYGLDFTEAEMKLSVYDAVDFLKMDMFAPASENEIGPDGLRKQIRSMFFKTYRHPIDPELLNYCLRGRLLIEWVKVGREIHQRSAFQRSKFSCLQQRLSLAFSQPLLS